MSYAKEITGGSWFGVKLPEGVRAFDCRNADGETFARSPWGTSVCGSERAALDMGLRTGISEYHDTTMLSCRTYTDARTADETELKRQVTDMVKECRAFLKVYAAAKAKGDANDGKGGSCIYKPVALTMSNYGWAIIGDERTRVIRAFSV